MKLTEINNNLIPNEPTLSDVLEYHRKGIFLDLNCHHIGTVKSFDAAKQTAQVTINYKRTYFTADAKGVVEPRLRDYPVIVDAPVIFLGGGGFSLTFPVAAGDECLVLFNDRDIDGWFAGSSSSANPTSRLHCFADALILVGIRSLPNVITAFDTDGLVLRNKSGSVKIKLKDDALVTTVGGVTITQGSDGVKFEASADGTTLNLTPAGKFSITNSQGEFLEALNTILSTAMAGGYPLILDADAFSKLQSFQGA